MRPLRAIEPPADYTPAHNLDAEASLLGAMMVDNRLVDDVLPILDAEDFFEPVHGDIYNKIVATTAMGEPATPVTLIPRFRDHPAIKDLGGPGYLAQLTEQSASLINALHFARQIAQLSRHRKIEQGLMGALKTLRSDPECEVGSALAEVEGLLMQSEDQSADKSASLAQCFDATLQDIEDEAAGRKPRGVTTAFLPDWDDITGTMRPGEVIVCAARPGMGKTSVASSVALGAAKDGHGTLFVSLEMPKDQIMRRMISDLLYRAGNAPSFADVIAGRFTEEDRMRLGDVRAMIADWPLSIISPALLRIGSLSRMVHSHRRMFEARGHTLRLVVVDYLQLVKSDDKRANIYETVSEVSRSLKRLAKECGVTILALAQLNREVEKRDDKRPHLADLRDSGQIEQDADTVIFLHRAEYYLRQSEPDASDVAKHEKWLTMVQEATDRIDIYAAKRRNGELVRRKCWFFAKHQATRGSKFFQDQGRWQEDVPL